MKARSIDKAFDEGDTDITEHFDVSKATRPKCTIKRVNVDFPQWMVDALDDEAKRVGVSRQSVIKVWLAERLDRNSAVG